MERFPDRVNEELAGAIAVVGAALRVPGARSVDEYWQNLRNGVESIRRLTDEDLRAVGVDEALLRDPDYVRAAASLDGIEQWDAGFFGFNPREAAVMDPQHRLFLECAWESLELAGHRPDRFAGAIGVFAGSGMAAYLWRNVLSHADLVRDSGFFLLRHTGNDKDFLATRVSYCFDLRGPSINVQTACSTSLVAIHLACQSLLNGECDLALAGGVTIEIPHGQGYVYKEGEIFSPDGHCRPFDAAAAGTVFGSGAAVVALRRLEDAIASGDTIHAIVRGSAINNDGSGKVGYLAPSVDGQAAAITEALAVAGVTADTIGMVEAHGTGTAVGDPIEVTALTQAFRKSSTNAGYCALGSVKSNFGHLDTAAGVASFIKVVESLKHGEIPPTLHFGRPHPAIDWETSPFYVNATPAAWPAGAAPRRAGVSSLGVGGTNAHVVLEEAPVQEPADADRGEQLLVLSGRSPTVVERRAADLAGWLERNPDAALADVAFTLSAGRSEFRHRRFAVASDAETAVDALLDASPASAATDTGDGDRPVAFLFAGGGAQYAGMGAALYEREPTYRKALDACLDLARRNTGTDLRPLILAPPGARAEASRTLERPSLALPALFATQYSLAQLLLSWGIAPAALIGHSMGEYTAACLAGVFSLEDAMAIVALRGRLFESVSVTPGAMTSVPMSAESLQLLLSADLSIAAENGPELCVASGPIPAVEALEATLAAQGIECRRIHIDTAAHSSLLEPILPEFRAALERIRFGAPSLPFVSNLSGGWADAALVSTPDYWVRHLRQTVRFSQGLRRLFEKEGLLLVEVGPGRTLTTLARAHPDRTPAHETVTTVPHPGDAVPERAALLGALGRMWQLGVNVDWDAFWSPERRRRIPLPTYPFERAAHWIEPARPVAQSAAIATLPAADGSWFHRVRWEAIDAPAGALPSRAVVFVDGGGAGEAVVEELRAAGIDVSMVRPGTSYTHDGSRFTIDPDTPEHYDALLAATLAPGRTTLLHLWNLDALPQSQPDRLAAAETQAFHRPLRLLQALAAVDASRGADILFLTSGALAVAGDGAVVPERALLAGPARVAPRELPHVRSRLVDVDDLSQGPPRRRRQLAALLMREMSAVSEEAAVAWRGGERLVERFGPMGLEPTPGIAGLVRPGAVILITGGTGGIGRTIAERLQREHGARLVLVSRRGLPARASWPALEAQNGPAAETVRLVRSLEARGGEIMVRAADVTDAQDMAAVVRATLERFGRLDGVIHAAGTIDDAPLALKTRASAADVLAPKVRGALALHGAVAGLDLDFFTVFSSRSALLGAAGQVDYTAANAYLDAFAAWRTHETGQPTISVAWDAWKEVGMAADLARGSARGEWQADTHPVLRRRRSRGSTLLLEGELDANIDWVVGEHRVRDGHAVLPGSAYVELTRAAWLRDTGEARVQIRDLLLLAPLALDGDGRSVRLRIEPAHHGRAVTLLSRPAAGGDWVVHARARVEPAAGGDPPRHDVAALRERCTERRTFDGIVPHAHLDFGRRWSSLRAVSFGAGEAVAELELPREFAGDLKDWALHPALIDLATGAAQPLVDGYDPERDFYVPASYGAVTVHGALPPRIVSHIRHRNAGAGKDLAVFDVTIMDEAGTEIARFQEFTMVRVTDRGEVEHALASAAVEPDEEAGWTASGPDLTHAIAPAEGAAAFERLLAASPPAHVLVSPRTPAEWFAELAPPPAASAPPPRRPAAELPDVTPVEQALLLHGAVEEAAALAHAEGSGRLRIVAFVVYRQDRRATVSELRRFLRGSVPEALVPNSFVELERLPRTAAGEPDRNALPNPFARTDTHVPPRTPTENLIADIWKGLLGVERIGVHDNFLDIGGHSLLGVRALLQLEKATGVRLSPTALTLQTLAQLAAECDRGRTNGASDSSRADDEPEGTAEGSVSRRLFSAVKQVLRGGQA